MTIFCYCKKSDVPATGFVKSKFFLKGSTLYFHKNQTSQPCYVHHYEKNWGQALKKCHWRYVTDVTKRHYVKIGTWRFIGVTNCLGTFWWKKLHAITNETKKNVLNFFEHFPSCGRFRLGPKNLEKPWKNRFFVIFLLLKFFGGEMVFSISFQYKYGFFKIFRKHLTSLEHIFFYECHWRYQWSKPVELAIYSW